jgi:hypothetical protein
MDVDKHNLDKAREQIHNKLLAEITKQLVDPIMEKHKNDQDCVRVAFEGTAIPIPADTDVNFDIKGQSTLDIHAAHLKTEQLLKDWTVTLEAQTIYDNSHKSCAGADDLPQTLTEDIALTYAKGTYLFKDNKHPDSNDKDEALAADDCKIKFRVKIIVTVRRTRCYTVLRLESDRPQSGNTLAANA